MTVLEGIFCAVLAVWLAVHVIRFVRDWRIRRLLKVLGRRRVISFGGEYVSPAELAAYRVSPDEAFEESVVDDAIREHSEIAATPEYKKDREKRWAALQKQWADDAKDPYWTQGQELRSATDNFGIGLRHIAVLAHLAPKR